VNHINQTINSHSNKCKWRRQNREQ